MRFPNHVSCSIDMTGMHDWGPVFMSLHPYCGVASSYVPIPSHPHVEPALPTFWPPGFALGKNQLTSTVKHRGWSFAQEGHDLGPAIPHISIPPDNTLVAVLLLTSKRKAMFATGEVKADGKPVGCLTMYDLAVIPTPMMMCSVPSLPIAGTGMSVVLSSLIVGMHGIDLLAGWAEIIVSILIDVVTASAKAPEWAQNSVGGSVNAWMGSQFTDAKAGGDALQDSAPGLVGGLVRLGGQWLAGYRGDATLKVAPVDGAVGAEFAYTRAGDTGRSTLSADRRVGPSDIANVHQHGEVSFGGGEAASGNVSAGVGLLGSSGDVGASTSRPTDQAAGGYGSLSSPFGSGDTNLGDSWGGDTSGLPEL